MSFIEASSHIVSFFLFNQTPKTGLDRLMFTFILLLLSVIFYALEILSIIIPIKSMVVTIRMTFIMYMWVT